MNQASVTDMARFMIAHLQNGRYSDATFSEARILEETTAQQMHSTLYTPDPRLLAPLTALLDMSDNGQRTLGHQGYGPPMNSLLLLLPDQNLGVFVADNSWMVGSLTTQHSGFQRAFSTITTPPLQPLQSNLRRTSPEASWSVHGLVSDMPVATLPPLKK